MKLPYSLRALSHSNYRRFVAGQAISHVGDWVQAISVSWLIYRLTGSTFMLGLGAFSLHIPLLLAPMMGVLLDRIELRKLLLFTNGFALVQASLLFFLVATQQIEVWHLIVFNLVLGLVNACDFPARQSLVANLIERQENRSNAIALSASAMNVARFVGPMIGGWVIATYGEPWSFFTNMSLRIAVIAALVSLVLPPRVKATHAAGVVQQFAAGLRFAYGSLPARSALLLLAACSLFVQAGASLMPWFAVHRFHGDSTTLGRLVSCSAAGAVGGLVYLATRKNSRGLFRSIAGSATAAGMSLVAFSFSGTLWIGLALNFLTGMTMLVTAVSINTALHMLVPDELRGRIAALYVASFLGMAPVGALLAGWAAEFIGPPATLALGGGLAIVSAGFYARQLSAINEAAELK